jgi:hypothetical protein
LITSVIATPEGVLTFAKVGFTVKSIWLAKDEVKTVSDKGTAPPLAIVTQAPLLTLVPVQPFWKVIGVPGVKPRML